ncbi:hypothetical protein BDY24DRAFT_121175 [Mrakia frigida]|uniref:uncharacterized protein n=1 Tax=Mrakia frigida TaxID=29902 RepID=UPI003FCC0817
MECGGDRGRVVQDRRRRSEWEAEFDEEDCSRDRRRTSYSFQLLPFRPASPSHPRGRRDSSLNPSFQRNLVASLNTLSATVPSPLSSSFGGVPTQAERAATSSLSTCTPRQRSPTLSTLLPLVARRLRRTSSMSQQPDQDTTGRGLRRLSSDVRSRGCNQSPQVERGRGGTSRDGGESRSEGRVVFVLLGLV